MSLILLPNLLTQKADPELFFAPKLTSIVLELVGLFAESEKGAALFLKRFREKRSEVKVKLINEHTKNRELSYLIEPLKRGERWGLISDAGAPCLADPGSDLVRLVHAANIPVEAVPFGSSILMALILSGLPGQRFTFHGYLDIQEKDFKKKIKALERRSKEERATQLFIEAPYRNVRTVKMLQESLFEDTDLSISVDLGGPGSKTITKSVKEWKEVDGSFLNKCPAVFSFCASLNELRRN